ncbi:uncharacterized protein LOC142356077 [Convolutriloba macropyga]|uniref:uncharacterized protein LOC142356077 n=1 Tax=Convolutriloba macropyga TaxID=536237 RepID=UPI003F520713
MGSNGKEWNYEGLSLIRDTDPADFDSQWQKVAENKLAEDSRLKRRSASHKSAKMIARSQSLKRSSSGKVAPGERRSSMRESGKQRGVLLDTKTGAERPMTKGDFTRLAREAAKLMVSVDAMNSKKEDSLFVGCKKWIVAVYTERMMGMNSGFKFYIRLHGQRRSSKLIELARSETNKFKFQSQQVRFFKFK